MFIDLAKPPIALSAGTRNTIASQTSSGFCGGWSTKATWTVTRLSALPYRGVIVHCPRLFLPLRKPNGFSPNLMSQPTSVFAIVRSSSSFTLPVCDAKSSSTSA